MPRAKPSARPFVGLRIATDGDTVKADLQIAGITYKQAVILYFEVNRALRHLEKIIVEATANNVSEKKGGERA